MIKLIKKFGSNILKPKPNFFRGWLGVQEPTSSEYATIVHDLRVRSGHAYDQWKSKSMKKKMGALGFIFEISCFQK